jgi:hypothetical protein
VLPIWIFPNDGRQCVGEIVTLKQRLTGEQLIEHDAEAQTSVRLSTAFREPAPAICTRLCRE